MKYSFKSIIKKPFCVCSGMQIFGSKSQEGNYGGLNFIPGDILKFPENKNIICPHVGWNKIHFQENKFMED